MTHQKEKMSLDIEDRKRELNRNSDKKERVALHKQRTLDFFDKEPGFEYRYVNDVYGRIEMFLKAGWSLVEGDVHATYSGKGREVESQKSGHIWRVVNKGDRAVSKDAVLMKIPKEYYDSDQAEKIDRVYEAEKQLDPNGKILSARKFGASSGYIN